jgi:ABC-2 type transport system ATP-binding protein
MNIIIPDEGQILFDGTPITAEDKNHIGYLPEERGLYKKMKLGDVLLYFASLKSKAREEAEANIDRWLERFELSSWKNSKVDALSKGMSQKAQFIAAVAHDPDIIFLDEPFAGLDPVSTDVLREAILDLSEQGKTILFSTHIMEQAEKLCHSILIMDHGREVLSGPIAEIKSRFGRNNVTIEFDGRLDFLKGSPVVGSMTSFPRWVEVELAEGRTTDELYQALAGKVSVRRFEVVAPSLHKIFVQQVGRRIGNE